MEYMVYTQGVQEKIEKMVLMLYTLYGVGICIIDIRQGWSRWLTFFIAAIIVACWAVHLSHLKTYTVRACVISMLTHINVIILCCHTNNFSSMLVVILSLTVIMAMYGIPELIGISAATTVFSLFYHIVVLRTFQINNLLESGMEIFWILSLFLGEYMVYFWAKKRNESTIQFYRLIKALQEAERSKDDFLANVSHEIRTPVNTICGMSELVMEEENPQKMKDAMFDIQVAGKNLLSVVSDVLDFSELQSGKIELEEEVYNITSTINDIINMTMAKKSQKELEFIVDCNAGIPCGLMGDEKRIRRVISNLVNNAIKFTNEGGVTLSIDYRRESYGINLVVTVSDTGIGMRRENLEKLFTSFNQVDTKRNRQEGGIGLGLAIAKVLVEKMGGVITIQSKLGKGTTARFVIPQKIVDAQPIARLKNKSELNLATFIDMEQFRMMSIRDAYTNNIAHMIEQMQVRCHNCRSLAELKRREQRETFSHIFISIEEYLLDSDYFDELAKRVTVIVILEPKDEKKLRSDDFVCVYKPFYILPIVQYLNRGKEQAKGKVMVHRRKFMAPDVKVLVVDDNVTNIHVIQGLLERYKIHVVEATSGNEALRKIESKDFDFVFMDHMMPEMDGVETLHRIRAKAGNYYQRVPVIVLTANAIAGSREKFLEEGFNDFLEKPVEITVLERVILRTISSEKMQDVQEEENVEKKYPAQSNSVEKAPEEEFIIGDLDVKKGMMYCGGKERYLQTLAESYATSEEVRQQIQSWFEEENWKNYTIGVHGLKSTMMSIGAVNLSDQAKRLEEAGKKEYIDFIRLNHNDLIEEHKRVMEIIKNDPKVPVKEIPEKPENIMSSVEEEKEVEEKDEITESALEQFLADLEDAAYELDGSKMMEVLSQMRQYQFAGISLEEALAPAMRKVEMSDFMSALDFVTQRCESWKEKKEGGSQE